MTRYNAEDLNGDWEFKILRSVTNAFRRPEALAQVLQAESMGGWELVEKFDDGRLRLKRPKSARQNDASLPRGYNPYVTQYGIGEGGLAIGITIGIGAVVAILLGIVYLTNGSL